MSSAFSTLALEGSFPAGRKKGEDSGKAVLGLLLFVVIGFVPVVRVGGVPVPLFLAFAPVILLYRPAITVNEARLALAAIVYVAFVCAINYFFRGGEVKDALFFLIPVETLLGLLLFRSLITVHNVQAWLRIGGGFVMVQYAIMLAQLSDLFGLRSLLAGYWLWLASSAVGDVSQGLKLVAGEEAMRATGTFGIATLAGILCYVICRANYIATGKRRWLVYAIVGLLLTSHRTGLVIFAFFEFVVAQFFRVSLLRWAALALSGIVGTVAFLALLTYLEVSGILPNPVGWAIELVFLNPTGGLAGFYSYSYRLSMYQWAFSEPYKLLFGGLVLSDVPDTGYIDSEFVMRSLQFGLFGYLCFQLLYWRPFSLRRDADALFLPVALVIMSLTQTVASNAYCVPFLMFYHRVLELKIMRR